MRSVVRRTHTPPLRASPARSTEIGSVQGPTGGEIDLLPSSSSSPVRFLRRFPVTTLVLMPYVLLILPEAIIFANPGTDFIVRILSLAVVPAFLTESILQHRKRGPATRIDTARYSRRLLTVAKAVALVGMATGPAHAGLGAGSVFAQTGQLGPLPAAAAFLSPFAQWPIAGVALLVAAHLQKLSTRAQLFRWLALVVCSQIVESLLIGITAPLIGFVIFAVTLLLYTGVIDLRMAGAVALVVLIAWPSLFALRNEDRVSGGVAVSSSLGAFDRLRYDLQITRADGLGHTIEIETPGPADILRYGLVPRFLDPGRPESSTGARINVYLGGSATSSYSFLSATNLYVLDGPVATSLFYVMWAVALSILLRGGRRVTPLRVMYLGFAVAGPLGWFTTYPDSSIGLIQGIVSTAPVALFVLASRIQPGTGASRDPALGPTRRKALGGGATRKGWDRP